MIYRLIAPQWLTEESPGIRKVIEGKFTSEEIEAYNNQGYNIYYLPNFPSAYDDTKTVSGEDIDTFKYVFVDCDLKDGVYADKEAFYRALNENINIYPSVVVDSGNGVHAYWAVSDLDAMSYLKLSRRLIRLFSTDEAVGQIYQLMRTPNTINTKSKDDPKLCSIAFSHAYVYNCEQLDSRLPPLTKDDELHCLQHFNKTYAIDQKVNIDDQLPLKFSRLLFENKEVKELWTGPTDDRSKTDYRLGHVLFASGFTRAEAASVLVNTAKALVRAPKHRMSYATNIIDKIWTFEIDKTELSKKLSNSVRDILSRSEATISGTRFPCHKLIDDTVAGFRLGHVIGLVAGSGVGKTAMAVNMFKWFTERNPDYDHFFVSLEQTDNEIAARWRTICGDDTRLHDKVHVLSNYGEDGSFRHLSLGDIKDYILQFQKDTGKKIGTCVIDHIGALKKQNKNGESQALVDICHQMKSFAVETNTLVIMQSQAPREKAGIGDLELTKDSAYGTVFFESYVDWLLCIWQPLKRTYAEGAPTVMAFKYAKIRHKKQNKDSIQEDVCYQLLFDPETERLRSLTEDEEVSARFFQAKCVKIRGQDRKTDMVQYNSRQVE